LKVSLSASLLRQRWARIALSRKLAKVSYAHDADEMV
jgi:hypothetical protein